MWYSSTKIGIAAIDMEHGNIDTMLSMIMANKVEPKQVGKLIDAMIDHFQHEEQIIREMGKSFPEKHRLEHEKLTELLLAGKETWNAGQIDALTLAQNIKQTLIIHINDFDRLLTEEDKADP